MHNLGELRQSFVNTPLDLSRVVFTDISRSHSHKAPNPFIFEGEEEPERGRGGPLVKYISSPAPSSLRDDPMSYLANLRLYNFVMTDREVGGRRNQSPCGREYREMVELTREGETPGTDRDSPPHMNRGVQGIMRNRIP